jgi:dTDP-4-dehydrorhamnose reductase
MVTPISTEEYGALAPRPRYSVLDQQALIDEKVNVPRPWKEALKEFIGKERLND